MKKFDIFTLTSVFTIVFSLLTATPATAFEGDFPPPPPHPRYGCKMLLIQSAMMPIWTNW